MSKECYAHSLWNCSWGISKEHLISSCTLEDSVLFNGPRIRFPAWKSIWKDNAVGHILCKKHNSELSILDAEAWKFVNALSFMSHSLRIWSVKLLETRMDLLDWILLERWFLKTIINLTFLMKWNHQNIANELLPYIYWSKKLEYPYWLCFIDRIQYISDNEKDEIEFAPIFSNKYLIWFWFRIKWTHWIVFPPWVKKDIITSSEIQVEENPIIRKMFGTPSWHHSKIEGILTDYSTWNDFIIQVINFNY